MRAKAVDIAVANDFEKLWASCGVGSMRKTALIAVLDVCRGNRNIFPQIADSQDNFDSFLMPLPRHISIPHSNRPTAS